MRRVKSSVEIDVKFILLRNHLHCTTLSEYLNDDSDSVTDQCDVNLPSTECHAQLDLTTTDNSQSPGLRRSTRAKYFPGWHKDYIMY